MSRPLRLRPGGRILVDALIAHGVKVAFGVPGESFLPILDAVYAVKDELRFIICRHEGGAGFMAEAYGKLTGRPGVALVTRGPGACNASIAVHTAYQDSTPMVLLIGQVPRPFAGREAFQEVEYRQMFAPLAKWVTQVNQADKLPEAINRAFQVAMSGRPGPVVLALPEDMLADKVKVPDTAHYRAVRPYPSTDDIEALRMQLRGASKPVLIVGGGGWTADACADLRAFIDASSVPTGTSFRCQDLVDNTNPNFIGDVGININPRLKARVQEADLVVAVGCRLGEITTQGYTLLDTPRPRQTFVHVHADPTELGRVYEPDLAINAGVSQFAAAARRMAPVDGRQWLDWARSGREDYLAWLEPGDCPGRLDMGAAILGMRNVLPPDAVITNDAGNFAGWVSRFHQFRRFRTQLGPTNGAMGYAVPAAVAAKIAQPDTPAVAFVGDGGALMTGQELATAMHYGLNPVIVVVNNGMYGTIRMHQEKAYPGRVIGTDLTNPDFVAWGAGYGAHAERVETADQFPEALSRALASGKAAVIEMRLDREAITTQTTLSALRELAKAKG